MQTAPQLIILSFSATLKERAKKHGIVTMTPEEYIGAYFAHSKCVEPSCLALKLVCAITTHVSRHTALTHTAHAHAHA